MLKKQYPVGDGYGYSYGFGYGDGNGSGYETIHNKLTGRRL
jgi:hypothetical protein